MKCHTFADMPMVYYASHEGLEVAAWRADEPEDFFTTELNAQGFPSQDGIAIAHPEKRLQWFASRYVLCTLYPDAIARYRGRKPLLHHGPHISISHSGKHVAVALSASAVGIDLQWPDPKLHLIARRFVCEGEVEKFGSIPPIEALTALWAIKEAVFKYHGTGLPFRQIKLTHYSPDSQAATVQVSRNGGQKEFQVHLARVDGLWMAFVHD